MQFLTDYQERTRKGQGKDEKRTKGKKRTSKLFLFYFCLKEQKRQEKTKNIKGIPLGFYAR